MQYLKDHQYTVITMQSLIDFFDHGTKLAKKPVLITVDDGYDDFANFGVPILREFQYPSTLFTPTGLIQNPGYLTWGKLNEFGHDGTVLVANHTWSHHNMQAGNGLVEHEITIAEKQLKDHGFDAPKVFAYPYGLVGEYAKTVLAREGYLLAFTTQKGDVQCKKQRLILPRFRIGNSQLSAYGL
jgi:peptidoglycan/xylan/chitin deacetylase (PgdA/CDA1 family)